MTTIPAGETTYEHNHEFFEVFLVEEGVGSHVYNGQVLALQRGSLAWVRAEDCHFIATTGSHLRFINLALRADWWAKFSSTFLTPVDAREHFAKGGQVSLTESDLNDCRTAFESVSNEPRRRPLTLTRAVATILDYYVAAGETMDARHRQPQWLGAWLQDLQDETLLARPLSFWQARSGVSAEHLARTCRAQLGSTPTELLNASRVRYVQRQLLERHETVINLALDAGFDNLGYFYRCFRKLAGATPKQWLRDQCERSMIPRAERH